MKKVSLAGLAFVVLFVLMSILSPNTWTLH